MRYRLFVAATSAALLGVFTGPSHAQSAQSPQGLSALGLMVIGEAAGNCSIFDSQQEFQKNAQMPGGDEFVTRFWTAEAARSKMTLAEYAKSCAMSRELHKTFSELAEKADAGQR